MGWGLTCETLKSLLHTETFGLFRPVWQRCFGRRVSKGSAASHAHTQETKSTTAGTTQHPRVGVTVGLMQSKSCTKKLCRFPTNSHFFRRAGKRPKIWEQRAPVCASEGFSADKELPFSPRGLLQTLNWNCDAGKRFSLVWFKTEQPHVSVSCDVFNHEPIMFVQTLVWEEDGFQLIVMF